MNGFDIIWEIDVVFVFILDRCTHVLYIGNVQHFFGERTRGNHVNFLSETQRIFLTSAPGTYRKIANDGSGSTFPQLWPYILDDGNFTIVHIAQSYFVVG